MEVNPLATPCLLYCGSCRFLMTNECQGCGTNSRSECEIYHCCREEKGLDFCTSCTDFPCEKISRSAGVHPKWLAEQASLPLVKRRSNPYRNRYPSYYGFTAVY